MAKTTKGTKGKMTGQGVQRTQRAASGRGLLESTSKVAKKMPTTVGKMLKTAKDAIAKIPGQSKRPKATVGELAKLRKDEKNPAKLSAKTKAPSISDTLAGEKKGGGKKSGFASRAKNADLRAQTVPTGRKGAIAQPPLDDAGKRHH